MEKKKLGPCQVYSNQGESGLWEDSVPLPLHNAGRHPDSLLGEKDSQPGTRPASPLCARWQSCNRKAHSPTCARRMRNYTSSKKTPLCKGHYQRQERPAERGRRAGKITYLIRDFHPDVHGIFTSHQGRWPHLKIGGGL